MTDPQDPREKREYGDGRVAFLAQVSEIRALVDAGWPLKRIYRDRRESLGGISYQWFCQYVKKHIRRQRDETEGTAQRGGAGSSARAAPPKPESSSGSRRAHQVDGGRGARDAADLAAAKAFYGGALPPATESSEEAARRRDREKDEAEARRRKLLGE